MTEYFNIELRTKADSVHGVGSNGKAIRLTQTPSGKGNKEMKVTGTQP